MAVINAIFLKPYPEKVGVDIRRHMSLDSQPSYLLDNKSKKNFRNLKKKNNMGF